MIETFYGRQFLGFGILIDQLGSYFVLSTLGILVACRSTLRPQHQCEDGDPKDSSLHALSSVRAGGAAYAVRIPDVA